MYLPTRQANQSIAKLIIIKSLLRDELYLRDQMAKADNWPEQVCYHNAIKVLRRWRKEVNET